MEYVIHIVVFFLSFCRCCSASQSPLSIFCQWKFSFDLKVFPGRASVWRGWEREGARFSVLIFCNAQLKNKLSLLSASRRIAHSHANSNSGKPRVNYSKWHNVANRSKWTLQFAIINKHADAVRNLLKYKSSRKCIASTLCTFEWSQQFSQLLRPSLLFVAAQLCVACSFFFYPSTSSEIIFLWP